MTESEPTADASLIPLETWLERVRTAADSPRNMTLSADERRALLELARVAAHSSERVAAPLSTFLAGVASADLPADERGAFVRRLTASLTDRVP